MTIHRLIRSYELAAHPKWRFAQSEQHPLRSLYPGHGLRRTLVRVLLGALVLLGLSVFALSFVLGPFLVVVAMPLAIAALALAGVIQNGNEAAVTREALALGAPPPIAGWGKVVSSAGACPAGGAVRTGETFAVSHGQTWPALCPHAQHVIIDALKHMEADQRSSEPVRYHDTHHQFDFDLYRVRDREAAGALWKRLLRRWTGRGSARPNTTADAGRSPFRVTALPESGLSRGQKVIAKNHVEIGEILAIVSLGGVLFLDLRRYGPGQDELYVPTDAIIHVTGNHVYLRIDSRELLGRSWHEPYWVLSGEGTLT